jgi:guanylate kinase
MNFFKFQKSICTLVISFFLVYLVLMRIYIFQGQFIQTYQYNGQWYGLQMESIESVAREGLACVVHMELEVC